MGFKDKASRVCENPRRIYTKELNPRIVLQEGFSVPGVIQHQLWREKKLTSAKIMRVGMVESGKEALEEVYYYY